MLSDSYVVEVTYKQGEEDFDSESWFVKVKDNINIVKILNLFYHSLCAHLYHFFMVSIHYL